MMARFCLVAVLALTACGHDTIPPSALTISISPAQATAAANGTVNLTGSASGFSRTPSLSWYMQEGPATPATPAPYCGYLVPSMQPNVSACIYGYVTYTSGSGTSGSAVYHAPNTPGTYHVVLLASQSDGWVLQGEKTATAEITVTP